MSKKLRNTNKGITLIALVITIIVMLILVAVTISMAVNGGLFNYAGKAVGETQNAIDKEQQLANGGVTIGNIYYNSINEYIEKDKVEVETIPTTESYVGCYADFEGDGTIDGIIYADLAKGNTGDGEWINESGIYDIPTETGLKEYYVSQTACVGTFGTEARDVITAAGGDGKERFYVMALTDIDEVEEGYSWYASKNEDGMAVSTSGDFETGKTNTATMIGIWNADEDEEKDSNDVWGHIQTQVSNGWFLPSRAEWAAFMEELDITSSKRREYGLSDLYWTSSQNNERVSVESCFHWCVRVGGEFYRYRTSCSIEQDFLIR